MLKCKKNSNMLWTNTAYNILIERSVKYVMKENRTLKIRFEQCGPKENNAIFEYNKNLKINGMPFDKNNSEKYCSLNNSDFNNVIKELPKRKTKENIFIQIADLYLYPIVKAKYDNLYAPWNILFNNKKIIDSIIEESDRNILGIKYSCFEYSNTLQAKIPITGD